MNEEQVQEPCVSYAATVEESIGEDMPVAEMTAQELKNLIQGAVKEVLQEVLGDPDMGLELRPEFEARLRQAKDYVASGGRLLSMEELTGELQGASGV